MKTTQPKLVLIALLISLTSVGQITFGPQPFRRNQSLNQYTSVFISSPNSGTVLQNVRDQNSLTIPLVHSDKYQLFDQTINNYQQLDQSGSTIMTPGRGYVLQLGGNGDYTGVDIQTIIQNFAGGSQNNGTVAVPVTAGKFALLGNPYNNYLDLDYFLLNANNKTKIKGPVYLWTHNTVISPNNPIDPDPSPYRYTKNDYAIYNVLGGVAAGRSIGILPNNTINGEIVIPNGKVCFGTGFFVTGIGTGNVNFENNMRDNDVTGIIPQSFKTGNPNQTQSFLSPLVTRSRIWLNLERLDIPLPNRPLKQLLIGYSTGYNGEAPTDGENDRVFDALTVTTPSYMKFYSYVVNALNPSATPGSTGTNIPLALGIQGRETFNRNHFFRLGYNVTVAGAYTITTSKDGIFDTTPYYIFDTIDNQYHTLPYTFTTAVGTFDTRLRVVFENPTLINSTACGTTMSTIWTTLFSNQIAGAVNYKYEVRDALGNLVGVYDGNIPPNYLNYQFNLNIAGAIQFNSTYTIRVATYMVDGAWAYGPPCTITTPPPPQTKLDSSYCNTVIASKNTSLFCGQVTGQLGFSVSGYRFEVRLASTGQRVGIIEKNNNAFQLVNLAATTGFNNQDLPYTALPSTIYSIRVQIKYNDSGTPQWQVDGAGNPIYGPSCDITTGNPFRFSNIPFSASVYPNPFSNNFKIDVLGNSKNKPISVSVYDMLGRIVDTQFIASSDIATFELGENYASGVYNVFIKQEDEIEVLRIIKR